MCTGGSAGNFDDDKMMNLPVLLFLPVLSVNYTQFRRLWPAVCLNFGG